MAYWLMKSEPEAYSWQRLLREGRADWDGVRNHLAARNMKSMRLGERAFFYHSVEERAIVGVMEIVETYKPDPSDKTGKFGMVAVKPLTAAKSPVALQRIKAEPKLAHLALVRQSRLSVSEIDAPSWKIICRMAGIPA